MPRESVYLDWNATTPPLDGVVDAMVEAARRTWGNPSSVHAHGRQARAIVEDARASVAELATVDPRDVVLTSGGTEANNLALRSAFAEPGGVLVTSRLEHPSIVRVAEALEREGRAELRWLRVLASGAIDLDAAAAALADGSVRLLAVQAVNHETGVFQPIRELMSLAAKAGVKFHVDAVQAFGRVAETGFGATTRSLASHKIRGPKGIGALILGPSARIVPLLLGGEQERGLRPGTVDPVAAAGFAVAASHARSGPARYEAVAALRDRLERALVALGAERNGGDERAPHVTSLAFPGWRGAELVAALDLEGVSVSSGSACSAGTPDPSPCITAMVGMGRAVESIRVSLGEDTSFAQVVRAEAVFRRVLARGPSP